MPQKIGMFIGDYTPMAVRLAAAASTNVSDGGPIASLTKAVSLGSASLSSAMIGRIHNARPGCGSCGRK